MLAGTSDEYGAGRSVAANEERSSEPDTREGNDAPATPGPYRVLIVEDDYVVGVELETSLAAAGCEVVGIAMSAEEAVALAQAARPSLVIMDIRLKGQRDGVDAALEIFGTTGIRCIFASAHREPDLRKRAEPAKPFGWVAKPYEVGALVALVQTTLAD
jgi:DNA-binding NarL/FixJ family response regulator